MDGAIDCYANGAGRPASGWRQALVAVAVLAGVVLLALRGAIAAAWWPGELVRPIDPDLETLAIFVGTFAGVLAAAWTVMRQARGRLLRSGQRQGLDRVIGPALALVAPVLLATATTRWGVQEVAFAGLVPVSVPVSFTVVGGDRSGRSHQHWLRLRMGEAGRAFSLPVAEAVYDAARPGDTVSLPVQTGRRGIQRMWPDRRLTPADLHHPA